MGRMMACLAVSRRLFSRSNTCSRPLLSSKPNIGTNNFLWLTTARSLCTVVNYTNPHPYWRLSSPPYTIPESDLEKNPEMYDQMAEAIGLDMEHWCLLLKKPKGDLSRDELINHYIKLLAAALNCSEQEARMKIYWVSTKYYYGFGVLADCDTREKFLGIPGIQYILFDTYENMEKKEYRGEPFINGEAVPYDPKYHEGYWTDSDEEDEAICDYEEDEEKAKGEVSVPKDYKHWIVNMDGQQFAGLPRDEIIHSYIKIVADHVFNCSEEEARRKIYLVSTEGRFEFGLNLGQAFNGYEKQKLEDSFCRLPGVRFCYLDSHCKSLIGEPFDGKKWWTDKKSLAQTIPF